MKFAGKELSDYDLDSLLKFKTTFDQAMAKREEASKHSKFNVDNGKIPKMEFPILNPEFLKLQTAIEEEIRKKQNV